MDPETGALYRAGNFYGGHIARLLDTWKTNLAVMANWGNALMALLVDPRFNGGLPANLAPQPNINSGFKGMQLSVTSLACADALECARNETFMVLLAAAQAVDLRGGSKGLGRGSRQIYDCIRQVAQFQDVDRPMEQEVAAVALKISAGDLRF